MNRRFNINAALVLAAMLVMPLTQAATMTKADYSAAKARVNATYNKDDTACEALSGNAEDICRAQAEGKRNVAIADLQYRRSGQQRDLTNLLQTKTAANYAVASERCDDLAGNVNDVCVKQAKAARDKSLAMAKMGKDINEATKGAAAESRDADYKVAAEKCDFLAGAAKDSCMTSAKAKFGSR